ncbi:MAG: hypothetical protein IPL32_19000 [Chloracidobacterium sp.]|nr:hypothetical protein [Chloracidobacterium sp.]
MSDSRHVIMDDAEIKDQRYKCCELSGTPHDHIGMSGESELNAFAKEISKKNGTPRNVAYAGAGIEEYEATQAKLKEMRSATIKECIDKLESLKTRGLSWEDDIKNASLDHAILILSKLQGLMVE